MGHKKKMGTGCGIREILWAGYAMKISWRDRDALIRQLVGCGIVLKLLAGCGILTTSDLMKIQQGEIGIKILKVAGCRDKAKTSGGMRDLKTLFWTL